MKTSNRDKHQDKSSGAFFTEKLSHNREICIEWVSYVHMKKAKEEES